MKFRIYVDESGTHDAKWFLIGMLFVPNHGALHAALCQAKEDLGYFNNSPRKSARYRETHLTAFRSPSDLAVGKRWIDLFFKHACYFRCVVVDWGIWESNHFGDAFDPEALKKRRAYKKWAEMLLHPELKSPMAGTPIFHAKLYMDKLRVLYGYDVLDHLHERFTGNYQGESPYIELFQPTDSWRDANQCLQLCDLLTGCQYQALVPSTKSAKLGVVKYLGERLREYGVRSLEAKFWRQYAQVSLTNHFPKYSSWFWQPSKRKNRSRKRSSGRR